MRKKISVLFIIIYMLTTSIYNVSAATQGVVTFDLSLSSAVQAENAVAENQNLTIYSGGSATFEVVLPFNSTSVSIKSLSGNGKLNMKMNGVTYNVAPKDKETIVTFDTPQRMGQKTIIFSAQTEVILSAVTFHKENIEYSVGKKPIKLTEYEAAIQTAVVLNQNSPIIKVNGAKRYVDYNYAQALPISVNDTIYLPVLTLARALGYYYEELKDQNYTLLRKDNIEFCFIDDGSYKQVNSKTKESIADVRIYQNGVAYLPVRYFAEAVGKYVGYKEGFIVIDYKSQVNQILNSDTIFIQLRQEFDNYQISQSSGKTYYVAQTKTASDFNDGTVTYPFKTLEKAGEIAKKGDTVIIKEGVYREVLAPKNNGTATQPITFMAAEGENVTISATETVSQFVKYKNNIMVSPVTWDLGKGRNQLFYNGECIVEGRSPNVETDENGLVKHPSGLLLSPLWNIEGDIQLSKDNKYLATSETVLNQEQKDYWKGAFFVSLHGFRWDWGTAEVKSSKKGQIELGKVSQVWWFDPVANGKTNVGFLTSHINTIDLPGEWTLDNHMLYVYPPKGSDSGNLQVEMKKRQLVIDLTNSKYVQIKGINTIGGGVKMNNSELCVLNECQMKYISHAIFADDFRGYEIDRTSVTDPSQNAPQRGEMGIYLGGNDNAILNSRINYSAGAGLYMVGAYSYVENNDIGDCGYIGGTGGPIHLDTEGWKDLTTIRGGYGIYNNSIYHAARSAFNLSATDQWIYYVKDKYQPSWLPFEVAYNDIYDGTISTSDTGTFYMWGSSYGSDLLHTKVHNNVIYSTQDNVKILAPIYFDDYSSMGEAYDNLFFAKIQNASHHDVFVQFAENGYGVIDNWNNTNIGQKDNAKEDLTVVDYPNARPFQTGCKLDQTPFTMNYNQIIDESFKLYTASDAILSEGVTVENGLIKFSGNEQWVEFKDVDFGEDNNVMNITFKGDSYHTGDEIQIVVGDDLESGKVFKQTLTVKSKSFDSANSVEVKHIITGKHNLYIKMKDYKSAMIERVYLSKQIIEGNLISLYYDDLVAKIFAGDFSEVHASPKYAPPAVVHQFPLDKVSNGVNGTWGGVYLKYADVALSKSVDKFLYTASSGGQWAGQTFQVRIGSPTAEPIAEGSVKDLNWFTYPVKEVNLTKELPVGTYDIYLTFDGEDLCSDFYWIGLK